MKRRESQSWTKTVLFLEWALVKVLTEEDQVGAQSRTSPVFEIRLGCDPPVCGSSQWALPRRGPRCKVLGDSSHLCSLIYFLLQCLDEKILLISLILNISSLMIIFVYYKVFYILYINYDHRLTILNFHIIYILFSCQSNIP